MNIFSGIGFLFLLALQLSLLLFSACSSSTNSSAKLPQGSDVQVVDNGALAVMEVPLGQQVISGRAFFQDSEERWPAAGADFLLVQNGHIFGHSKALANGMFQFSGEYAVGLYQIHYVSVELAKEIEPKVLKGKKLEGPIGRVVADLDYRGEDITDEEVVMQK